MTQPKTILISGASGLVGSAVSKMLQQRGHSVRTLSRSTGDVRWDVEAGQLDASALDGVDAVIHLAGEPIAQRWSDAARERILQSRVKGTSLLAEAIAARPEKPSFICASGSNFYGHTAADLVDETSPSGEGFLAEVCRAWEGAAQPAIDAGARTVFVRTGIVLAAGGGALAKMLTPFKLGLGGRIAGGNQRMSWISLHDLAAVYSRSVEDETLSGAINAVSPNPVCNGIFTKTLGKVLGRPTIFPFPAAVVTTLFGDMGRETVLADLGVLPQRLEALGFAWQAPDLEQALRETLS